MRIPDDKIEEIRATTDLVELIGGFVALKKSGKTWKGLCPFHTERTPSFHVVPDRGIYHCFGCGRGGNVFGFLMEHEGMSFLDSVRFLADRAGIALPKPGRSGAAEVDAQEITLRANRAALDWFRKNLADPARGARARDYLAGRRLGAAAIEAFSIGYATPGWDGLITHLVRLGFEPPALERAGLVIRSERGSGYYDRFRDRVIFPILGPTGQPIAFGGRVLDGSEPKYLNSPETPVFRKGKGLFGLYVNRGGIRESGEAVLVEGYTDLIALHESGIRDAVAPLGTAFTAEQARLLANHARRVVLLYDGDDAGRSAALRAVPALLGAGVAVRIALLPSGVDPDEFARSKGAEAVRALLRDARGWVAHVAEQTAALGREEQARRVAESLAVIPDPLTLGVQIAEASTVLGLPEEVIRQGVAARRSRAAATPAPAPSAPSASAGAAGETGTGRAFEKDLLRVLLQTPALVPTVARHLSREDFQDARHRRLAEILFEAADRGEAPDPHKLLNSLEGDDPIRGIVTTALTSPQEDDQSERFAIDCVVRILRLRLESQRKRLQEALRQASLRRDQEAETRLLAEFEAIKHADAELPAVVRIQS